MYNWEILISLLVNNKSINIKLLEKFNNINNILLILVILIFFKIRDTRKW